jgi:hypothetical protein
MARQESGQLSDPTDILLHPAGAATAGANDGEQDHQDVDPVTGMVCYSGIPVSAHRVTQ